MSGFDVGHWGRRFQSKPVSHMGWCNLLIAISGWTYLCAGHRHGELLIHCCDFPVCLWGQP